MKKRNLCTAIGAAIGMLILILDGKTALAGAADGITLCMTTLVPSLFPFFLLSILLTGAVSGHTAPLLKPVAAACKIPNGAESLLAIGLLGGYPVGAQNVALLHRNGQLTDSQAARMILFCNNAGPAFIFGILGSMFSDPVAPWLLWGIHIVSALLVGIVLPGNIPERPVSTPERPIRFTDALERAIKVMALVCGWVILMRMVLHFLERWFLWLLPKTAQVVVAGILELSNGCIGLAQLESEGLRFVIAAGLLSLGGICVTLQTASVAEGISMKQYFPGKILQCSISVLLACLIQSTISPSMRTHFVTASLAAAGVCAICLVIFSVFKKIVEFQPQVVYNRSNKDNEVR